ncbi:MAG TPA: SBBP repeat-containing protein, partial [Blastocatellia bacterium]|nr:SBBP repeat-containing protein [Blastocatellia bacterium]
LVYSTYLGGGDTDGASGIAVDSTGEAYVTGVTSSRDFPTVSAFQPRHGGGFFDAFVAKLNAAGDHVLYSTYLGGGGEDRGLRIAADSAGNAYVTGDTDSTDFPTVSPFQSANQGGGSDAFVAKLNSAGSALVYSTYLGGSKLDGGTAIAVDSSGFAYVTGFTASSDFPVTAPTQQAYGGGAFDAFVAVLNPTGSGAIYSSYLGGSGIDSGFAVASNPQGGLCVMGQTDSKDLPVFNAFQPSYGGDPSDVFVARIKIGPVITSARVSGKSLLVLGIGFDSGATILLNGNPQKTARDAQNPSTALIGRKAGKLIKPGHTVTLQVKDADGILSNQFSFTRPTS